MYEITYNGTGFPRSFPFILSKIIRAPCSAPSWVRLVPGLTLHIYKHVPAIWHRKYACCHVSGISITDISGESLSLSINYRLIIDYLHHYRLIDAICMTIDFFSWTAHRLDILLSVMLNLQRTNVRDHVHNVKSTAKYWMSGRVCCAVNTRRIHWCSRCSNDRHNGCGNSDWEYH